MENIIKRLNFIAFLKLFRTEKSVKKRRTMGGIYHYEMECQSQSGRKNKILKDYIKYFS